MTVRPVTAHAILRYLTRIEAFDLAPIVRKLGRDAGSWATARAAADAFGCSIEDLQKIICPDHLLPAVTGGAARVHTNNMVLVCDHGRVVSILATQRRRTGKLLSRREIKQFLQRRDRRVN